MTMTQFYGPSDHGIWFVSGRVLHLSLNELAFICRLDEKRSPLNPHTVGKDFSVEEGCGVSAHEGGFPVRKGGFSDRKPPFPEVFRWFSGGSLATIVGCESLRKTNGTNE